MTIKKPPELEVFLCLELKTVLLERSFEAFHFLVYQGVYHK